MIRTFHEDVLHAMQTVAEVPLINGLTNNYHPCQTLADLLTLQERFPNTAELKIAYIGDGNNILHSLLIMATKLGIQVNYCCPSSCAPAQEVLTMLHANGTAALAVPFEQPQDAVKDCQAVYTDVWTSMGFDLKDKTLFNDYQINEALMQQAADDAIFMHCMPMNRGEEVSTTLPDQPCSVVFQQSENRLHVQKALLVSLLT